MFHIRIAGILILSAAMVTTAAAQPHKGGGGGGKGGGGGGGPAPHAAPGPAPRPAPAPHIAAPRAAPAPHPAPAPHIAAPRAAPAPHPAPAPHVAAPRAAPRMAAPRHAPQPSAPRAAQQQRQVSGPSAHGRGGARIAQPQPSPRENPRRQGGPPGAAAAAPSTHGGRNAAPQPNLAAPQQNAAQQRGVIPPNQVVRTIPQSATRARNAINPRAFSGGVLRNQSFANLAATRDAGARTLARSTFQGRFFDPQWRRHFSRPIVIGWVGPLFWPYAYDDFYDGMFGAYALGYDGTYASAGPSGSSGGYGRRAYALGGTSGGRSVEADLCSGQTVGLTDWPIERIADTVEPNDAQRAILDELRNATAQALDQLKVACPTELPSTPTGRLEAMRQRLEAMVSAVRTMRPVIEKFYNSLNDEQKARFNALSPDESDQQQAQRSLTQVCGERASGIAGLPLERIERTVQPDGAQRSALKALQDATSEAANLLSSECPTYRALTPVVRLQAMEQRLDAMLHAVQTVQPALEKFYSSLDDEQKERFNRLSPAQG
jgi:LTXXQ motif family protein